jgi:hypothetical protein
MTGNYGLTFPVMLAAGLPRRLSYGTIYTRKLRGIDTEVPGRSGAPRCGTTSLCRAPASSDRPGGRR